MIFILFFELNLLFVIEGKVREHLRRFLQFYNFNFVFEEISFGKFPGAPDLFYKNLI